MKVRFSANGIAKVPHKPVSTDFEARGKALRSQTDERLDHLTGLWREVEKKLLGLQQPRHVYYLYETVDRNEPNGPPDNYDRYCIGIAKYAGKWRLCLGEFNDFDCDYNNAPISWRPITDCTMEERTNVAQYVKQLEQKIVETGEQMLPKLDEAIRHLENRLAEI